MLNIKSKWRQKEVARVHAFVIVKELSLKSYLELFEYKYIRI